MFNFNENNEKCNCERCQIINDYLEAALETESKDELHNVLSDLLQDGYDLGFTDSIREDIEIKANILKELKPHSIEFDIIEEDY